MINDDFKDIDRQLLFDLASQAADDCWNAYVRKSQLLNTSASNVHSCFLQLVLVDFMDKFTSSYFMADGTSPSAKERYDMQKAIIESYLEMMKQMRGDMGIGPRLAKDN